MEPPAFFPTPPPPPKKAAPGWLMGLGITLLIVSLIKLPGALGSVIFGTLGSLGAQFHSEFEKAVGKEAAKELDKEKMSEEERAMAKSILSLVNMVFKELLVPSPLLKAFVILSGLWESLGGLIMLAAGIGLLNERRWALSWCWASLLMSLLGSFAGLLIGGISGGVIGWSVVAGSLFGAALYTGLLVYFKTRDKAFLLAQA